MRSTVRDNNQGAAVVSEFHGHVRNQYIKQLHVKDMTHFGTAEGDRGPLGVLFRELDFKALVFGSVAEMSSNVKDFVEMTVEYGVEHLGTCMAASTPDVLRVASRMRYRAQLSMAAWRGYANLIVDRTKNVGTGRTGTNIA